jgi:hypothetical protein
MLLRIKQTGETLKGEVESGKGAARKRTCNRQAPHRVARPAASRPRRGLDRAPTRSVRSAWRLSPNCSPPRGE